ncbi:hypothetical protein [Acinetobacter higginsii]|uniref:hypothetical protein n=1 Tax=Acinetobacter higginsii TaxID=70347 RepID=UPI001F4A9D21|nr:hypothetical protein [Acinetobacter higginsii]MCH7295445.1 hypothetical protein [Acinetobacter higginsii]
MVEQDNAPNWQEMDKAMSVLENALDDIGYLPTRKTMEEIYLDLRKVALEHARIEN